MTVSVQSPYNESIANGVTTVFPFTFKLLLQSDLRVFFNGVEQLSGFTVSGIGVNSGGNVTFTTPPANLVTVLLKRELVLKRDIDYQENGDLPANGLDNDIDRVWQAIQQFGQLLKASIKLPFTTSTEQIINDSAAVRANTLLGFDTFGNVVLKVLANLATTPISIFFSGLLNLNDAIALRAAIGANPDIYTATTTGTASAYLTAFSPTLTDFSNNPTFKITFDKTCADNATIQIAGITPPLNLKYKTSIGTFINVSAGDILANHTTLGLLINNNTDLLIQPASASGLGGNFMRNRTINGAIKIDQRNTGVSQTFTAAAALAYCVDRFYGFCTGANVTGQRVTLANNQNRYRFTGLAGVTGVGFGQRIESFNCMDLAGLNASLQVKLSSSSLTAITWTAYYATTADTFGTLAAPTRTQIATGTFTINSTEATYTAVMAVPAAATTGIEIVFTGGALLATQTLTIGDVQFEAGNATTSFELERLQSMLSNCQRYYFRTLDFYGVQGNADSAGRQVVSNYSFPVTMRAVPTGLTGGYSSFTNCVQTSFSATVSSSIAVLGASAVGGFSANITWGAYSAEL